MSAGIVARALTYATLFVGIVLVYVPAQILTSAGVARPRATGVPQLVGILVTCVGAAVAAWSILTFAVVGRGTPVPFDPPRRLVVKGPYRHVRNPMYIGAAMAVAGAALFYQAMALLAYAGVFLGAMHLLVIWYEEPALLQMFGAEYDAYCRRVHRWRPILDGR